MLESKKVKRGFQKKVSEVAVWCGLTSGCVKVEDGGGLGNGRGE